jgi:hypothetical protein
MFKINLSQMAACVDESRLAWLDADKGPPEPVHYAELIAALEVARLKLPPLYRTAAAEPFLSALKDLGAAKFAQVLHKDPKRESTAGLMIDIAQAILQNSEGYQATPLDAFQEVISDLYDGFLSAEDRRGIKPPDYEVIPPLVKWGNPDSGPYTWPVDATSSFGLRVGVVNLPPANARHGLCAWAALGHECGGHDILHADEGLLKELTDRSQMALMKAKLGIRIADYWSSRMDETASDVLGVLNLGPAAAVGVIAYFRGINAALGYGPKLSSDGPADDPHPADLVRGYVSAEVVRLLLFSSAGMWADAIVKETDKDAGKIVLAGDHITALQAKKAAAVVARTIAATALDALDGHAFSEIQNWRNRDELLVAKLMPSLSTAASLPATYAGGSYAAHVVSAAVMAALENAAPIPKIFERMVGVLKQMHDANPSWGPLYVVHPGDIARDFVIGFRPPAKIARKAR